MTTKKLTMTFTDNEEKIKLITLPNAYTSQDLQDAQVAKAMDDMIESGLLQTKEGKVTKKKNAYLTQTMKTAYDVEN